MTDSTMKAPDTAALRFGPLGPNPDTDGAAPPVDNVARAALISRLLPLYQSKPNWSTFSGKGRAHYQGGDQDESFNVVLRMEKGKAIWFSIRALGLVEVASGQITPDSLKMINRLDKSAFAIPYSAADKLLPVPVDFQTLERVLIGSVLSDQGTPIDATDFGGGYTLTVLDGPMKEQITWNKADTTLRQQEATAGATLNLLLQYGSYRTVNDRPFSAARVIRIMADGTLHFLSLDYTSATFDEQVNTDFTIPAKYKIKALPQ